MKTIPKPIFLLFLMVSTLVSGQPKGYKKVTDTETFKEKFTTQSQKTLSNEADFIQEKYVSVMTEKIISKGKFYYKKENLLRWETLDPTKSILVLNNGKMTIKENNKIRTYDSNSNKQLKGLNDIMIITASGNMLNSKEYSYTLYENERYYLTELMPLTSSGKKVVKRIELVIDKRDYSVTQLKLIEPSDDYIKIDFLNKKSNHISDNQLFTLK